MGCWVLLENNRLQGSCSHCAALPTTKHGSALCDIHTLPPHPRSGRKRARGTIASGGQLRRHAARRRLRRSAAPVRRKGPAAAAILLWTKCARRRFRYQVGHNRRPKAKLAQRTSPLDEIGAPRPAPHRTKSAPSTAATARPRAPCPRPSGPARHPDSPAATPFL